MSRIRSLLILMFASTCGPAWAAVNIIEGPTESPWVDVTVTPAGLIDGSLSGSGGVGLGAYGDEADITSSSLSGWAPYGSASVGSEVGLWYARGHVDLGSGAINGRAVAEGLAHLMVDGSRLSIHWDCNEVTDNVQNGLTWHVILQDGESLEYIAWYSYSSSPTEGTETVDLVLGRSYRLMWYVDISVWELYGDYASCDLTVDLEDLGDPPSGALAPVYRFWSPLHSRHFYTINEAEKDAVIATYPSSVWTYEGTAFYAFADSNDPNTLPVYRFWSPLHSGHFYTMSEAERDSVIATYPASTWTYEGPAFYAYPEGSQPTGTRAVHRFWSPLHSGHFYTISQTEKDQIVATYPPDVWTYEAIAWYAYE